MSAPNSVVSMKNLLFGSPVKETFPSLGLLFFRLIFGGFMLFGHGWGKLMNFSAKKEVFPDPLGIGGTLSLGGAVFSEVVLAALIMVGFLTRLSAIPLIFTMLIAAFVVHGPDPFFLPGKSKEPALIYLTAYLLLLFTGPGKYSVDSLLGKEKKDFLG